MNDQKPKPRPVCCVVMPFGERQVAVPSPEAPTKLNCDALRDKALRPALEDLGYLAIRADIEMGTIRLSIPRSRFRRSLALDPRTSQLHGIRGSSIDSLSEESPAIHGAYARLSRLPRIGRPPP